MRRGNDSAPVVVFFLLVVACSSPSPTQTPPPASSEDWSGFGELENVLRWTPEQQLRGYRNMDKIFPTRAIPASPNPYSLPEHFVDLTGLSYEFEDETYDMAGFLKANHVVGLLVIKRGELVVERYALLLNTAARIVTVVEMIKKNESEHFRINVTKGQRPEEAYRINISMHPLLTRAAVERLPDRHDGSIPFKFNWFPFSPAQ